MKSILQKLALLFIITTGLLVHTPAIAQTYDYQIDDDDYNYNRNQQYNDDRNRDVTYQDFYDELSGYGRWVDYPGHGYVWVPDTDADFQPYSTNGRWVWTDDYEWMWVSDYDWGWAPFHYGRWDHDNYYGWYWVPGYEWAPAWVAWRDGGDYYGWAPLRPGFNVSINIGTYSPPERFWCFTPRRYITSPRWYDYRVDRGLNINIINYTTIINYNRYDRNYGFRCGPRRYDAELYCGRINPVRFRETYSPGRTVYRNNEVNIYRPRIRQHENNNRYAPQRFERYDRNNGFRNNNGNGGFRNDNGGRRPDDRDRVNNDRGFRSVDNGNGRNREFNRNDENNNRGRNERDFRPTERNRDMNNGGRTERQPDNNSGNERIFRPTDRSRDVNNGGGRTDNNNGNGRRPDGERQRPVVEEPDRRFERPTQPERRVEPQQQPPRQFERREERRVEQPNRTFERPAPPERRVEPQPQQQPARQFERREERRVEQPTRSIERPAPPERRSEPQQQFERRVDNGGSNNNGGGQGGGRRNRF
jgi:hypothetical protein